MPPLPSFVQGIVRAAQQARVDPARALSFALEESGGNPRAVGDQGTSFGAYQLHQGGALGKLTPQQAFDPYQNAMAVLPSWSKLGGGKGLGDYAAALQYYSGVGRGASNTVPAQRSVGLLPQARQLVSQYGGTSVPSLRTQVQEGTPGTTAAGGLPPALLASLQKYGEQSIAAGLAGNRDFALPTDLLGKLGKIRQQAMAMPTGEVARGAAPAAVPPVTSRSGIAANAAMQELGVPYSWGGGTPAGPGFGIGRGSATKGFDCSALVQYAWAKAGVQLPRVTYDQMKVGQAVPNVASVQPGDLLFPHPGHVMMALGNGKAIESPYTGGEVRVVDINSRSYQAIRRPG